MKIMHGDLLLGLVEHVAHAGGTHADKHLDEVGAGDGEERHLGFAGNGLGEQGLAGTGLAHHQHAAGNAPTEFLELARIPQELHQFLHVFLGFVHTGHVGEGGTLIWSSPSRRALLLPKLMGPPRPPAPPCIWRMKNMNTAMMIRIGKLATSSCVHTDLLLGLAALYLNVVFEQVVDQARILDHRPGGLEAGAVEALAVDGEAVDHHALDLLALDLLDELRSSRAAPWAPAC